MNHKVQRVVVGMDGTDNDIAVLRRAAAEARYHHAELCPVHVFTPPPSDTADMYAHRTASDTSALPAEVRSHTQRLCDRALSGPARATVTTVVVRGGAAARTLVEQADRVGDMLIVGTGHRGRLHRLPFGSTAWYCFGHAACPVLAVDVRTRRHHRHRGAGTPTGLGKRPAHAPTHRARAHTSSDDHLLLARTAAILAGHRP